MLFPCISYSADFPVTVESCGQPLTFTEAPQRAVINDLNMSEMAFSLGLQNHIVGITGVSGWYKITPDFKLNQGSIPELAAKYPSLETLLAVTPDLFFAGWNYGMKIGGDVTPQSLAHYGIKTLVLSESCTFVDKRRPRATMDLLYGDEMKLGEIFGKREQALKLVASWKARVAAVQMKTDQQKPLKVFVYDSGEDKPFTSGKYAMPTAIIEAAGGKNIMDNLDASWVTTSWESVANNQPDVIILLDYQTGGGAETLQHFLESHPLMKQTPAVKNHHYVKLQYTELTPGPSNIDAVEKIANVLERTKSHQK
ncbi:ABC transporter substrate-binding protein [Erwinia piriflorinigrans]|nr:ABC transporter substrate-binding protein [Erwinia piriflorinigrans]